ncbi:MAG: hypothetical protein J5785_06030 [Spirochaetales bacterium]|nr:hypothetical protein [Spirochaetales bacterium]
MQETLTRTYDAKIDSRNRITLKNAKFDYYNIREFEDGRILLEPRVLASPFEISSKTLEMMDSSVRNFKQGNVSDPVDLSDFLEA